MGQFLTIPEMQAHLEKRKFRPGWTVEVYQGLWEGPHAVFRAEVPDAYDPSSEPVVLDIRSAIPPMLTTEQFDYWLQWRMNIIDSHEGREFFINIDTGRPVFDPHAEFAERDLA
jgi:hypothetical protein